MLTIIQRVSSAKVAVDKEVIGSIEQGIVALIGIEKGDTEENARRLFERISTYRIFPDESGKMNLSVKDIDAAILLVPQFTIVADTAKGRRPSFSAAASPEASKQLFEYLCHHAKEVFPRTEQGLFGADMQVSLCNDGPVTFTLQVKD